VTPEEFEAQKKKKQEEKLPKKAPQSRVWPNCPNGSHSRNVTECEKFGVPDPDAPYTCQFCGRKETM
jgi:hypothetical protein